MSRENDPKRITCVREWRTNELFTLRSRAFSAPGKELEPAGMIRVEIFLHGIRYVLAAISIHLEISTENLQKS